MSLWLWDADPQFSFSLADELTEVQAALIARCGWDDDGPETGCEVIDLSAKREALSRDAAARRARADH